MTTERQQTCDPSLLEKRRFYELSKTFDHYHKEKAEEGVRVIHKLVK